MEGLNQEILDLVKRLTPLTNDFIVSWWPLMVYVDDEEAYKLMNPLHDVDTSRLSPPPKLCCDWDLDNPAPLIQTRWDCRNTWLVSSLDDAQEHLRYKTDNRYFWAYRHRDKKIVVDGIERADARKTRQPNAGEHSWIELPDKFRDTAYWPQERRPDGRVFKAKYFGYMDTKDEVRALQEFCDKQQHGRTRL